MRYVPAISLGLGGFWLAWQASRLRLWATDVPGPGLFPLGIGCLLIVLGVALALQALAQGAGPRIAWPGPTGWSGIVAVAGGLALYALLLESAGFPLTTGALALLLTRLVWRQGWMPSLVFAVLAAGGFYGFFAMLLGVALPRGTWWP